jgi:hypothetical protein
VGASAQTPSQTAPHAMPSAVTLKPIEPPANTAPSPIQTPNAGRIKTTDVLPLLQKNACTACHAVASRV